MEKKVIFISHATPDDNYFATWLAAKLKLLGYEVWVELDELKSGDAFWPEIEDAIRNRSLKFLVIVSSHYLEKIKNPISGIFKERSCADRINIKNFKSPIRIADVNEDLFPVQLMGLNSINFYNNWQSGLDCLIESFRKEKLPKEDSQFNSPLNFWLDAFDIKNVISPGPEKIYTNWFPFAMPQKLYIHKPIVKSKIDLADIQYSFLEYSDRHICFFPGEDYPNSIECSSSIELDIEEILGKQIVPIDDYLSLNEPKKKIVELINKTFSDFLFQHKLRKYEQSFGNVFYFRSTLENRKRVSLKSVGKTNIAIAGLSKGNLWSFGISSYAILFPFYYLKINSHIIFEKPEYDLLEMEGQFKSRRALGSTWYNKDWLDKMIGFMLKLSANNPHHKILIPINKHHFLELDAVPFSTTANFGYREPQSLYAENE